MIASRLFLAASALAVAVAQNTSVTIAPDSVSLSDRDNWCLAERNTCTDVCGGLGTTSNNTCDPNGLTFACQCLNGTSPNMAIYQQSLPAFICREFIDQCVAAHPNDLDGITACRATQCGNVTVADPDAVTTTAAASSAAATTGAAASGSVSGASVSASATSSSHAVATAIGIAKTYGTGALAAGMMAAFGLAL